MAFPYQPGYPPGVQAPVMNPPVPYEGEIVDGMCPGRMIFIQGFVHDGAERFHVNLQCGQGGPPRPDIALHFNPRFAASKVVRNTLVGGKWGNEEKGDPGFFPFTHNQNFEMIILCELNMFKCAVNGLHYIEYNHRISDLQRINTIAIDGGCSIYSIRFEGGAAVAHSQTLPMPNFNFGPKFNPPVPYECEIDGGMTPGKMIFVSGFVNTDDPDRFHINLQAGPGDGPPRPDIAFHFNPRFAAEKVVRNALGGQKWGGEEKETPFFPFVPGGFFEVIILCQEDAYRCAVNGVHMIEFKHRQPCENVTHLAVAGAIRLSQIRFQ